MVAQGLSRLPEARIRKTGPVRDIEQAVLPVGEVEDPEKGRLRARAAGDAPVQAPLPELRLAFWIQVDIAGVRLEHVDDLQAFAKRVGQSLRSDELEVVRGAVVAGEPV